MTKEVIEISDEDDVSHCKDDENKISDGVTTADEKHEKLSSNFNCIESSEDTDANIVFNNNMKDGINIVQDDNCIIEMSRNIKENKDSKVVKEEPKEAVDMEINNENDTNAVEYNSNNSRKLKTIDIENNSSVEIFKDNEIVNVDVIQINETENSDDIRRMLLDNIPEKCALKFGSHDKEYLDDVVNDIDMESFKNCYLTEVDMNKYKCNFTYKHTDKHGQPKSNKEDTKRGADKKLKRNKKCEDEVPKKRRKVERHKKKKMKKYKKKKIEINASIHNAEIKVKIRLDRKRGKKKIKKNKKVKGDGTPKKKSGDSPKSLTQTVLNFSPETKECVVIKPENDVGCKKRKHNKSKSVEDNFKQTSLLSFFKLKDSP